MVTRLDRRTGRPALGFLTAMAIIATLLSAATPARSDDNVDVDAPGLETPAPIVIRGARITTAPGKVIEKGTIVIRDGLIVAVGEAPGEHEDAVVIDGEGLHVYAGFVDADSTHGLPDTKRPDDDRSAAAGAEPSVARTPLPRMMKANRKGIRPELRAAELFVPKEEEQARLRKLGVSAVVTAPRDELLGGTGALVALSGRPRRASVHVADVGFTGSFRTYGGGYPGTLMATMAHIRQTLSDASHHRELRKRADAGRPGPQPAYDPSLDALDDLLTGRRTILWRASSENAVHRVLDLAREFSLRVVIVGGDEAWRLADRLAKRDVPVILPLSLPEEPAARPKRSKKKRDSGEKPEGDAEPDSGAAPDGEPDRGRRRRRRRPDEASLADGDDGAEAAKDDLDAMPTEPPLPQKTFDDRHRRWEERVDAALRLHQAGVRFAFTTSGLRNAKSLHATIEKLVERGLPAETALAALTTVPAELAGSRLGRIEVGRPAHVTVLTAPVGDAKARVRATIVDGRLFEYDVAAKKDKELPPAWDFTGTWSVVAASDMGEIESELVLTQDGASVSGTLTTPFGEGAISGGKVQGNQLSFAMTTEIQGQSITLEFTGTFDGEKLVGAGTGSTMVPTFDWSGTRNDGAPRKLDAPDGEGEESKPDDAEKKDDPKKKGDDPWEAGAKGEDDDPAWSTGPIPRLAPADAEVDADRRPPMVTGGTVLIRGASIVSLGPVGTVERGAILVRDGRIAAIGPEAEVMARAGGVTSIVHADGHWVIPGVIDAHSHIATSGGLNEGSMSVTPEVRIPDTIDHETVSIYRSLAGGVTSIHTMHGSANPIGGQNAILKLRWGLPARDLHFENAPQTVKFALGENPKRSNFGRGGGRFPASRQGVEAVYRRSFAAARAYRLAWKEHAAARARGEDPAPPRRDLRLEALAAILDREIKVHCHSYRADEILMMLKLARDQGFELAALQHGLEAYKAAPEVAAAGAGVSTFADWWAYKLEAFDAIPGNAALCTRAGAVVSINSDSAEAIRHLWLEAAKCVKHGGLTAEEAIALVTLNPAKQLRIDDRVGSLVVGKDADVAIFDGHPLSGSARNVMTLVDGEVRFADPTRVRVVDGTEAWLTRPGKDADAPPSPSPFAGLPRRPGSKLPATPPAPPGASGAKGSLYAIVGATVHPMNGPAIADGVVVIRDGLIEAIGPRGQVTPPRGAHVVQARGHHVWPGMIDGGTTLGLTEIGSVSGSQDGRSASGYQSDLTVLTAVNPHSELIPVTRVNGVTSVLTAPSGGPIAGQSAIVRLAGWTPEEMALEGRFALHLSLPSVPDTPTPGDAAAAKRAAEGKKRWQEATEKLHDVLEAARRHLRSDAGKKAAKADPRVRALFPFVRGERPVIVNADKALDIVAAVRFAKKEKLKLIISGGRESWRCADYLRDNDVPVILGPILSMPLRRHDRFDAPFTVASKLAAAGVDFCFKSSDASNVRNLPYHASTAVAFGLDRKRAWRALTSDAARILGIADRVGTLAPGKQADVIVTSGDILEPVSEVTTLFIGGRPIPLTSKHTRLFEQFEKRLGARSGEAPSPSGSQ